MTQNIDHVTIADIEEQARRLQSETLAKMLRAAANRVRTAFGATINTETGRTA